MMNNLIRNVSHNSRCAPLSTVNFAIKPRGPVSTTGGTLSSGGNVSLTASPMNLPRDYSMFATNSRVAFIDALNQSIRQHCHSERSEESLTISSAALNDNQRCFVSLNMTG